MRVGDEVMDCVQDGVSREGRRWVVVHINYRIYIYRHDMDSSICLYIVCLL